MYKRKIQEMLRKRSKNTWRSQPLKSKKYSNSKNPKSRKHKQSKTKRNNSDRNRTQAIFWDEALQNH
jgi:hypothetical protein